jgi:hypothetical protein
MGVEGAPSGGKGAATLSKKESCERGLRGAVDAAAGS